MLTGTPTLTVTDSSLEYTVELNGIPCTLIEWVDATGTREDLGFSVDAGDGMRRLYSPMGHYTHNPIPECWVAHYHRVANLWNAQRTLLRITHPGKPEPQQRQQQIVALPHLRGFEPWEQMDAGNGDMWICYMTNGTKHWLSYDAEIMEFAFYLPGDVEAARETTLDAILGCVNENLDMPPAWTEIMINRRAGDLMAVMYQAHCAGYRFFLYAGRLWSYTHEAGGTLEPYEEPWKDVDGTLKRTA